MAPMTPVLQVADLRVDRDNQSVVRGITFIAMRGERVALMGASGAGKTTVLRAIAGLESVTDGVITVRRPVGMVFQFHHLFAHLSALQNVTLGLVQVSGLSRAEAERRALELLEELGVAHRSPALPHELSGGEAQRVAIARALAMKPVLLLMDEPTASLDPVRRGELAATVRSLSRNGTTILIATHDETFANACVDRVLLLHDGRILREGRPGEVLS
jgi:ABC-type polar amino acid transport system ATPase subunit